MVVTEANCRQRRERKVEHGDIVLVGVLAHQLKVRLECLHLLLARLLRILQRQVVLDGREDVPRNSEQVRQTAHDDDQLCNADEVAKEHYLRDEVVVYPAVLSSVLVRLYEALDTPPDHALQLL